MLGRSAGTLFLVLGLAAPGMAQEWARKMFTTTNHDFGTVARQAKAEFEFVFTNLYLEDVHVADARSSCHCTEVSVTNPSVKTYQRGAIVARFNTRAFTGRKGATITVTFDRPHPATVQLHVGGQIRDDVVIAPSSVDFGTVDAGTPAEQTVSVSYAGQKLNWQIIGVRSQDPNLVAEVLQTHGYRGQSSGQMLRVRLSQDAPSGYLKEYLMLLTNDPAAPQIPLVVEGWIRPAVTVSPATLHLGEVAPDQPVTRQIVVQAQKPCRVLAVSAEGNLRVSLGAEADQEPRRVRVILITITPHTGGPGKLEGKIRIETDLNQAAELSTFAVVK